jgi:Clostripain family
VSLEPVSPKPVEVTTLRSVQEGVLGARFGSRTEDSRKADRLNRIMTLLVADERVRLQRNHLRVSPCRSRAFLVRYLVNPRHLPVSNPRGNPMTRAWTFMVYMAGDNGAVFDGRQLFADLQAAGWRNIAEMSEVGSTGDVSVVVQYDTMDEKQSTPRLYIDGITPEGRLVESIPPVNTGDPRNLVDFVAWASSTYPAARYALVLWNHGTGWKEDDIYARYRERVERAIRGGESRAGGPGEQLLRNALFLSTAAEIMSIQDDETRGICYDDSSMDFLDNQKLAAAMGKAVALLGGRLSVVGMDACLMSMVEVACQMSPYADYMVGSQEVEQAYGWPYGAILRELTQTPSVSARELSRLMVDEFGKHYTNVGRDGGGINTQSAIELNAISGTIERMRAISSSILNTYGKGYHTELALDRSKRRAQCFRDEDYLDLRHFVQLMYAEYDGTSQIRDIACELAHHLDARASDGPVAANFHGLGRQNANGLSIYFPARGCSAFYGRQAFADTGWDVVIRRANGLEPASG